MYNNKIKYVFYTIFVIIIIVVITDARNRYTTMANKNHTNSIPQQQQNYYQQDNSASQDNIEPQETPQMINKIPNMTGQDEINQGEIQDRNSIGNYSERYSNNSEEEEHVQFSDEEKEINHPSLPLSETLLYADTKEPAEGYKIAKSFSVEDEVYAVISYDDPVSRNQYSKYVNKKYYIYKKIDNKLYRSNYLFDISSNTDEADASEIAISIEKYEIVFKIKNNITRRVSKSALKTNYYHYQNNTPQMILDSGNNSSQSNEPTNADSQNSYIMEN